MTAACVSAVVQLVLHVQVGLCYCVLQNHPVSPTPANVARCDAAEAYVCFL